MNLDLLRRRALKELEGVKDSASLERWRITFLGRKSELSLFLRSLASQSPEERRRSGRLGNDLREELEKHFFEKKQTLEALLRDGGGVSLDISQPGTKFQRGHLHPLTLTLRKMTSIFAALGFEIVEGPDIETEYYNFDALNIPSWHPARDLWDTFWLQNNQKIPNAKSQNSKSQKLLLRTHTSPMQIRYMETHKPFGRLRAVSLSNPPPLRIVVPGRVFRHEATDARHDMDFYQLEGLMVGEDVSFANFKWIMERFLKEFFGPKTELQLRAGYFPFVEPGFEVLMTCVKCAGTGKERGSRCHVCGGEKWLEMAGAGMVHPQVFRNVGYDPEKIQGFAFGMGPDRLAMVKYKIDDIRLFRSGDLRFIKQF